MPRKNKLPPEVIACVRRMAAAGMSGIEIGREMGRTPGSIAGICRRHGIKLKNVFRGATKGSGLKKGRAKAARRKKAKGWVDPNKLSQDERQARAEAAKEAERKRRAALEERLAEAAKGALHLPLVTVEEGPVVTWRNRTKHPYRPRHYLVTGLKHTTEDEPGDCRYPMTDEPPHTFCGKRCLEGSFWCPEHHDICTGEPRIPLKTLVKGLV